MAEGAKDLEERVEIVERETNRLSQLLAGQNGRVKSYYALNDVVSNLTALMYGDEKRGIDPEDSIVRIVRRMAAKDREEQAWRRGAAWGLGFVALLGAGNFFLQIAQIAGWVTFP